VRQVRAIRWALAGMAALSLAGWLATGAAIYPRLFYASALFLAATLVWSALSLRGMELNRHSRSLRASVGDLFEERFELFNAARWSCLWLDVINQSSLPHAEGSRLLTAIGGRQKRSYVARTWLTARGAFALGPTLLVSGDPFGLFTREKVFQSRETLVVLPMTSAIPVFRTPPGLLPGGKAVRQKTLEVTPHAVGVREFAPGDPMKRIHWPSTARRGRLMVKEFEQDPQAEVWIFLDAEQSTRLAQPDDADGRSGDGWWLHKRARVRLPKDTFEYAVSIAGSLARYFLAERRAVGLACAGARLTVLPAERGERQAGKILETLAFLQADGSLPLAGLVSGQSRLLPLGSSVILVTSSPRSDLLAAVADAERRNLRPLVVLVRPDTFGGGEASQALLDELAYRNIPACPIAYGDDLETQLSRSAGIFHRLNFPIGV